MSKKLLTKRIISDCIVGTDNGKTNTILVLVLVIIMFASVILSPVAILALVILIKNKRVIQLVKQNRYVLQEEIVLNKDISSGDVSDSYYLYLSKTGRKELHFRYVLIKSEAYNTNYGIYETTEIGDTVYLLRAENGEVLYMFNERFWQIDENEFLQKGDQFVPR